MPYALVLLQVRKNQLEKKGKSRWLFAIHLDTKRGNLGENFFCGKEGGYYFFVQDVEDQDSAWMQQSFKATTNQQTLKLVHF